MVSTVPEMTIDMIGALLSVPASEFGKYGDKLLLIQSQFGELDFVNGYFLMIPELESYDKLLESLKACKCPDALTTLGLGSCVGVALYDPVTKIGGLLHCMLPDSTQFRNNSNIAKFADTGIDELIRQMKALGAVDTRIVAKIAGGAQMFANTMLLKR